MIIPKKKCKFANINSNKLGDVLRCFDEDNEDKLTVGRLKKWVAF